MHNTLYPSDWKLRVAACLAWAAYRCEDCGVLYGVLSVGKRSNSPYIVYLHAAHVNHDPENPWAELRALCPSCYMKHDRRTERTHVAAHKQGYQLISATHLMREARRTGLYISQQGDRYCRQIGDLNSIATDVLDAIGSALHCLMIEWLEEVRVKAIRNGGASMFANQHTSICSNDGTKAYE